MQRAGAITNPNLVAQAVRATIPYETTRAATRVGLQWKRRVRLFDVGVKIPTRTNNLPTTIAWRSGRRIAKSSAAC